MLLSFKEREEKMQKKNVYGVEGVETDLAVTTNH